jgi:hypothetical protein
MELQQEMLRYRQFVAPLPVADGRALPSFDWATFKS